MTDKMLKKYIENVYKLEKSLYSQNLLYGKLNDLKENLEYYEGDDFIEEYSTYGLLFDRFNDFYDEPTDFFYMLIGFPVIGAVCGALIGAVFGNFIIGAIAGAVLGLVVFIGVNIYCLMSGIIKERDINRKNREIRSKNEVIANDNEVYIGIARQRAILVANEMEKIENIYADTKETLAQYYDKGIIYHKYRNFIAVSSFYDYFCSGRCSTLEGHEGAYNIYESERRLDKICDKLDDIIDHLESIERNQYMLFSAIQNCESATEKLTNFIGNLDNSLQNIENSNEIIAYNSAITAENTETLKWLRVFER